MASPRVSNNITHTCRAVNFFLQINYFSNINGFGAFGEPLAVIRGMNGEVAVKGAARAPDSGIFSSVIRAIRADRALKKPGLGWLALPRGPASGYNFIWMRTLSLGYSPCPNDTFIFYALVHGKVDAGGLSFRERLEDVETLNRMARAGRLDVTKASFGSYAGLRDEYCLLRSGGAMGRGAGPLVVSREKRSMADIKGARIAIPGENTTAYLLLRLYEPSFAADAKAMPFHEIMATVRDGGAEAGLVIHEGRFTYRNYGLVEVEDLGRWWEEKTGLPVPLGCIAARRVLGGEVIAKTGDAIRRSVLYAMERKDEPLSYIRRHARELDDSVIQEHIRLYVNDFSVDMGEEGFRAVEALFRMAEERGLMQKSRKPLFI